MAVCAAVYALGLLVHFWFMRDADGVANVVGRYGEVTAGGFRFWEPRVFVYAVGGTLGLIAIGSLYKSAQLREGGGAVARALGGRRIEPGTTRPDERRLVNVIEEMSIASGMPVPEAYVLDREAGINAFAAGRTQSDAAIGVTQGAAQLLTRDQLQGVVAHEFSHIFNGDSRINLRAIGLLHGIFLIALIGRLILQGTRRGSSRKDGSLGALVGVGLLMIGSIGVFFGRVIQAAISRQRETLADASAVQFTRNPSGLAGALKKIGGATSGSRIEAPEADEASHIFFANAVRRLGLLSLRTHPPLRQRILELDPSWNGEFEQVAIPEIGDSLRPAATQVAPLTDASQAAWAVSPRWVPASAIEDAIVHVGDPGPAQIELARQIHTGLPAAWLDAAHRPGSAQALVFGLLLAKAEEPREQQLELLSRTTDRDTTALARELHRATAERPSVDKMALVDIAVPTLRELSVEEYGRFIGVVERLVRSDRRIDLFEYAIAGILRRHLSRHFERAGPPRARFSALRQLVDELEVVVSTLAWAGGRDEKRASRAFSAALAAVDLEATPMTLRPRDQCTLEAFDRALERFAAATPALKRNLMVACAGAIIEDGRVADREAELIRAIGDALDCPVPAFVGSKDEDGDQARSRNPDRTGGDGAPGDAGARGDRGGSRQSPRHGISRDRG